MKWQNGGQNLKMLSIHIQYHLETFFFYIFAFFCRKIQLSHLINIHGKHLHWFMEWHSTVAIWYTFTKIFPKSKPKLNRNPFGSAGFVILLSPHWILDSCCLIFLFLNNIVNQIVFGWKKSSSSSLTKQIPQWMNKKPWKSFLGVFCLYD